MIEATLLCDFYKLSHRAQYPTDTEYVYSTWIPRSSYLDYVGGVVNFGLQGFLREWLDDYFNIAFFEERLPNVLRRYERVIRSALGVTDVDVSHLKALHNYGRLPLRIKAVPEGTIVPLRVPMLTVENTEPEFFWLTNYIETLMSSQIWQPATSATLAFEFRKLLEHWAKVTGGDREFVKFQGHDFSYRGMAGTHAAAASGAGHLLSFVGTDTIPAISYAEEHYGANVEQSLVGTSIPATEHSVMCAYGRHNELECYRRLITEVYPAGLVSIVSDTWDLWQVIEEIIAALRGDIMSRDGKVVIRPDSGDPVKIICGDPDAKFGSPALKGVVEMLWDIFGGTVTKEGYRVLDSHIGVIYGDAISYARAKAICERLAAKKFASTNMVYGIGSYTYQFQTRDTFGFALKSTWCQIGGKEVFIYKDPVTDSNHSKRSLTGRVWVGLHESQEGIVAIDGLTREQEEKAEFNFLETVFENGEIRRFETFDKIRGRIDGAIGAITNV